MTIELLTNKIEMAIVEVVNSKNEKKSHKHSSITHWDGDSRGRWYGLKLPQFIGKGGRKANKQD